MTQQNNNALPEDTTAEKMQLDIADFSPQSVLRVKETHIERARFPVIDMHTHLSWSAKVEKDIHLAPERKYLANAEELLEVMDRTNVRALINLTGGFDEGLEDAVARFDKAYPGRFITFAEPCYNRFLEPDYPALQVRSIERAHKAGAKGLKILKTLGLYLREGITTGELVKIDDPRFDPMWAACADLNLPVAIHVSDPLAFFSPTDCHNERFEELNHHPEWSFYGKGFPSNDALLEIRDCLFARHPRTQFIALHVGNFAEDLEHVSQTLDRFPNVTVDIAARIGELGRQPRAARKFFDRYQDRIFFGTDATPHGYEFPQQLFGDTLYQIYYRFLETDDEYFDYAPAPTPPQGRWRISGIDLPETILRKIYYENAARLLNIQM